LTYVDSAHITCGRFERVDVLIDHDHHLAVAEAVRRGERAQADGPGEPAVALLR
jgi:hypothetical protein